MSNTANVVYPITQNNAPYYDGAIQEIQNDYVQLLFQPGRSLQARELTTLQSLLQYQIAQGASFDFENGSVVSGGHLTFDNSPKALLIQANDSITLSDFSGSLLVNPTGSVNTIAMCLAIDSTVSSNTVEGALVVKYLSGNEFSDGQSLQISTKPAEIATLLTANAVSPASVVSINEGVFYVDGYFIYVPQQTVVVSSSTSFPSCYVGLQKNENIVTSAQDSSLYDPAQGSFNWQAPGADRFQLSLTLSTRPIGSQDMSQFIKLMTIQNGVITDQIDYPILGSLQDALAQRTSDINGSFTVNPFIVTTVDDPSNSSSFILNISPGKAYVDGYEFHTISTVQVSNPKAQTTNTSNNYPLTLEFGNYLTVSNVYSGNVVGFNAGNFGTLDVHLVPSGNINTTNAQAYSNTVIGTARIRDIEYNGANVWNAYVLSMNLAPIVVNANAVSANTTSVYLPPTFTSSANAIANVVMTVLSGNSSGDVRTIVSYNPTSRIGYLNAPTTQLLDTTSKLSLQFSVKDINSLVATPVIGGNAFATQNASAALYPCMDISQFGGKDLSGNTILYMSDFNALYYPLPQSYIAQNTISTVTFSQRLSLTNVAFTSGNTTIGTGSGLNTNQSFPFGYTNQYISDELASLNFFVVVRNSQTSNLANGTVITWNWNGTSGNGVYQTDSQHVTLSTITTGNFLADIFVTVQDNNASTNFRRTKTLTGNASQTVLNATDAPANGGVAVIGTANANSVFIDSANGYVWFTNYNDIQKTPGASQSLYLPDVLQIVKVFDSGNASFASNVTNATDITSRYGFISGQNDNYYDHSQLVLLPGNNPPSGQIVVILQAYLHDSTSGFFDCDSYSQSAYANNMIPFYSSQQRGAVSLRDVIDFRPTRTIGTTANVATLNLSGLALPNPDSSMSLTYQYYLGRIDKLVLNKQRQFALVQGTPALVPQTPPDQAGSMTLYTLDVPPYTYLAANVALHYQENKRYTMTDIGALDKRINQLEYYVSLNQLEQQTQQQSVTYQDGTAKEQYGMITDDFRSGFSVADVNNPDVVCSISDGELTCYQEITPVEFRFQANTGPLANNDRTYTLAYSETPAIIQNTASDYTQVQPYAFGRFKGTIKLYPQTDFWYSDNLVPQIVGPPVEAPAPHITPVVVAASNTGLTTPLNKANVSPPTVTASPPPSPPPPAVQATPQPVVRPHIRVCLGLNDFWYGPNTRTYYQGYAYGIGGRYYWGNTCYYGNRTYTGFGLIRPAGQWFPSTGLAATSASNLLSGSSIQLGTPTRTSRGGFGI